MKVVSSIRSTFQEQYSRNEKLAARFEPLIRAKKEPRWHYEQRIKKEESYAQKLETGRFIPSDLEDFFACTLVVENIEAINRAIVIIEDFCEITSRRPEADNTTHKTPDQFTFDDLRLYVKLKSNPKLPPEPINDIVFEIQIKTFLQHAWSIATHDLVYKANDISWAQQRIAFQTKALLETAETAISSSKTIATDPTLSKENKEIQKLKEIIALLHSNWNDATLPRDVTRLAQIVQSLMKATTLGVVELQRCIDAETQAKRGRSITNLSPYLIIIQSLISSGNAKMKKFLSTQDNTNRFKVFLPDEILIPATYPDIVADKIIRP